MKKSTAQLIAFAAAAIFAALPSSATTIKALSYAVTGVSGNTGDRNKVKQYIQDNSIDFGLFDYAKQEQFFINADFPDGVGNFKVVRYFVDNTHFWKYVIYDSNKYELVNVPADDKSGSNIAAVFRDANGDQFALISLRSTKYDASKESTTLTPAKTYIEGIAKKYPNAKIIVTYNAILSSNLADVLNTYLTETSSGPQLTGLGRTSGGGAYMRSADVPELYSVEAVDSIGTSYDGLLTTLTYPTKYKVVFNDWDGTGLQTNIVFAGESVTPPTVPGRDGYTFTGWDHAASEFASVLESFTATAQYSENVAWLRVSGDPEEFGTADPVYGTAPTNGSFTASVTATNLLESGVERWVCTGYTHYEITNVVTGAKTVAQEGNTASFVYTHVFQDELVWHFTNEWLVAVSSTAGGFVSVAAETWVRNADPFPIVVTPEAGYEFWGWIGDTNGIADVTATTIEPTVTSARSLIAVFVPNGADAAVQYVASETGSDANSGYLPGAPKLKVQAAINTLVAAPGYGTVYVAPGIYEYAGTIFVTNAISVLGATGNPEDVVLRAGKVASNSNRITIRVNHPDAFVANLAIEDGQRYQANSFPYGANLAIESKGGTVSNCVLRGGVCRHFYPRGAGAWLNSDSALLTHCVISNNSGSGTSKHLAANDGLFVHVAKGTVDNCLIAYNKDTGTGVNADIQVCGVTILDGRLLNSTVVTNEARYTGGVYLGSSGFATNVVVAGCVNMSTHTNEVGQLVWTDVGFAGELANASHCASDGGEALTDNCVAGTTTAFFRDFAGGDYRPALDSPLINAGIAYEGIASFDLLGKKRVQGRAPDIGCFEPAPSGLTVVIR